MMMLRNPIKLISLYADKYKDIFSLNYLPKIQTTEPFIIDSLQFDRSNGKNIVNKFIVMDRDGNILDISTERYFEIPEEGCILVKLEAISFIPYSVGILYIIDTDLVVTFPSYINITEADESSEAVRLSYKFDDSSFDDNGKIPTILGDGPYLYNTYIKPHLRS